MNFSNLTLEMSLKPFGSRKESDSKQICRKMLQQWQPLAKYADKVSVMLWISDGSEILDYRGNLEDSFEWAKYIGVANPSNPPLAGENTELLSIHRNPRLYCDNPTEFTYKKLKNIIELLKEAGRDIYGKTLRIGATFDPGPEFAKSSFKYERHSEICLGKTFGEKSFVCCYAELNKDSVSYAGFPEGIPQDTSLGTFLGRQAKLFTMDLGFDYIWMSNGFGFGLETWGVNGAVFDGENFSHSQCAKVKEKIFKFWTDFREECPDLPVETRGTNLSTGMDLASDAVPLREIYQRVSGLEPPPNSPWAALDGDFGLELAGWMSHIAELPAGKGYPFRFYAHDPWFLNSPWLDRYGRQPHDIYLPLSITRLNEYGNAVQPDSIEFLTVDDSFGNMPEQVPNEVIPEIIDGVNTAPDEAGPVIWLYPFDEYHDMTFKGNAIEEVFFGDWFMRSSINVGFPVNSVISTENYLKAVRNGVDFSGNVLVAPTAVVRNSEVLSELEKFVTNEGQVLLYGAITDSRLQELLCLQDGTALHGEFSIETNDGQAKLLHNELYSAGGLTMTAGSGVSEIAVCRQGEEKRTLGVIRATDDWHGGKIGWVRGTNSFMIPQGARLPVMLDRKKYFYPETLMLKVLAELGYSINVIKHQPEQLEPVLTFRRHNNAVHMAAYVPDITVEEQFHFPEGAPVFTETETVVKNWNTVYHLPKASNLECRVFVEQKDGGVVKCKIRHSGHLGVTKRLEVSGLKNAVVRFRPERGTEDRVKMLTEPEYPFTTGNFVSPEYSTEFHGSVLEAKNISGKLLISW